MRSLQGLKHSRNIEINLNITENVYKKVKKYNVKNKFNKQIDFLRVDPHHPSLDFKPVPSIGKGIWRFRINDHYWALTLKEPNQINTIRIYDVIKHP